MRFAGPQIDLALVDDPVVTKAAAVLKNVEAAPKIQPVGQRNGGLRARTHRRKPHPDANVTGVSVGRLRSSRGVGGIVRDKALAGEGSRIPFDGIALRIVGIFVRGRQTSCRKDKQQAAEEPCMLTAFRLSHLELLFGFLEKPTQYGQAVCRWAPRPIMVCVHKFPQRGSQSSRRKAPTSTGSFS